MPTKQKDNRYRTKIVVAKGQPPVWISARTQRELEEKKQQIRQTYINGVRPREATFHALVIEWFNVIKRPRIKAPSTLANYQNAINLHLLPFFPEKQLIKAVRRADLQRCLDACAPYSSTVGILVHSVITHVMKYAISENIISSDPSAALLMPSYKESASKDAFTPEQEQKLLETAASSPDGLMIYLLYYTGIRRGEMLGLRWEDFDWDRQLIHVQRSIDFMTKKRGEAQSASTVKTDAGDRYVPLPDALAAILRPLRSLPHLYLVSLHDNEPLRSSEFRVRWNRLMLQAGYAHISPRYYEKVERWKKAGKKVLNPNMAYDYDCDITPHWFRHNYITACVHAGIRPEVTMRIVGHSSYQTTIDIYTHIQKEHLKMASVSLAGVLRGESCQKVANQHFLPTE